MNERLLLSGLQVRVDGKVARAAVAASIGEAQERAGSLRAELARRHVHPEVLHFCRAELLQRDYFHAVLEAPKASPSGCATSRVTPATDPVGGRDVP